MPRSNVTPINTHIHMHAEVHSVHVSRTRANNCIDMMKMELFLPKPTRVTLNSSIKLRLCCKNISGLDFFSSVDTPYLHKGEILDNCNPTFLSKIPVLPFDRQKHTVACVYFLILITFW